MCLTRLWIKWNEILHSGYQTWLVIYVLLMSSPTQEPVFNRIKHEIHQRYILLYIFIVESPWPEPGAWGFINSKLSIPLIKRRGIGTETCGVGNVFHVDDLLIDFGYLHELCIDIWYQFRRLTVGMCYLYLFLSVGNLLGKQIGLVTMDLLYIIFDTKLRIICRCNSTDSPCGFSAMVQPLPSCVVLAVKLPRDTWL